MFPLLKVAICCHGFSERQALCFGWLAGIPMQSKQIKPRTQKHSFGHSKMSPGILRETEREREREGGMRLRREKEKRK